MNDAARQPRVRAETAPHDRDLAERLMAILVQLSNLVDAARAASSASPRLFDGGLIAVETFARQFYDLISDLNVVWIHERRINRQSALDNAWASFASIGRQPALVAFLSIACRVDVESLRRPSQLIATLLDSEEAHRG